jgi:hypothetical protein
VATDHVRIADYSDREILAMMLDLDGSGEVSASELSFRIFGLTPESDLDELKHGHRCVTSRLSWMRRFGLVYKGEEVGMWAISHEGKALRSAKLGRAMNSAVTNSHDSAMLEMAHIVGERLLRAKPVSRTAMRRELQFQILRGK